MGWQALDSLLRFGRGTCTAKESHCMTLCVKLCRSALDMKWINKIIDIKPYKVTCKWNDGKIRMIDLTEFLKKKSKYPENSYTQLFDKDRFAQVKCDGSTLYWEDGLEYEDYDGVKLLKKDIKRYVSKL